MVMLDCRSMKITNQILSAFLITVIVTNSAMALGFRGGRGGKRRVHTTAEERALRIDVPTDNEHEILPLAQPDRTSPPSPVLAPTSPKIEPAISPNDISYSGKLGKTFKRLGITRNKALIATAAVLTAVLAGHVIINHLKAKKNDAVSDDLADDIADADADADADAELQEVEEVVAQQ